VEFPSSVAPLHLIKNLVQDVQPSAALVNVGLAGIVGKIVAATGILEALALIRNHPPKLRASRGVSHGNLFGGIKAIAVFGGID
jgi:hypothetical protein